MSRPDDEEGPDHRGASGVAPEAAATPRLGGWYAHYVLLVLVIVYVFNFVDRNILSILAEDIKADLGVTDAQMGFLYGTVFAVFYAVFGIPLARFADVWVRRTLISVGLLFWSLMTALSGTARSFAELAGYRVGVGVGEASASPAAYSMLADYYSPTVRATVIAIYSSGVYIGGGVGLMLGGLILGTWESSYPDPASAPLGLKGWQAAFLAVGIPGILMALWVRTLREPVRGISEGLVSRARHPHPFRLLGQELGAMLPGFSLIEIRRAGGSLSLNLAAAVLVGAVAAVLIWLTGSVAQWLALGVGLYVTFTWAQSLANRDPATFAMMFRSKALIYVTLAFPTIAFVTYGTSFWTPPLLLRLHDTSPEDVGYWVGLGNIAGGFLGVVLGGMLADRLKLWHPAGRLVIGFIAVFGTAPFVLWMVFTDSLVWAFWLNFIYHVPAACWPSIAPTTASDLVMPRMRAVAGAYFLLVNTFIGLALGPYVMGQLSDAFHRAGFDYAEALQYGITTGIAIFLLTLLFLVLAWRHLPADEASRIDRARALGEDLD